MKGVWVLFTIGVAQVFLPAGAAHAAGASFFDGFDAFDASRWTKEDHNLGRSYLNPANVDVVDGNVMQTWKSGVPKGSMYLYTNLWFPNWLDGRKPLLDSYLYVDWTRYTG